MSDKQECPGCGGYSSSVLAAFSHGDPCPFCGLSESAATEIMSVRRTRADGQMKERLETVIKERDEARRELHKLRRKINAVETALADGPA